jgi:acetolactate synthase-1/2/3 large subunit
MLSRAYGIPAVRVETEEEVSAAIERALKHPGPFLIEFSVEPEENVFPIVAAGASLDEMTEGPVIVEKMGAA